MSMYDVVTVRVCEVWHNFGVVLLWDYYSQELPAKENFSLLWTEEDNKYLFYCILSAVTISVKFSETS